MTTFVPAYRSVRPAIGDHRQIAGVFETVDAACGLRGWLVHPGIEALPLRIEAWCQGQRLASSVTLLDRPDIDKALNRATRCGFLIGWSRFDRALLQQIAEQDPEAAIEVRTGGAGMKLPAPQSPLTARAALGLLLAAPQGDLRPEFATLNAWLEIEASGLFDPFWYFRQYGADATAQRPALLHYIQAGEAAGHRPNLYFDPVFYAAQAGLAADEPRLLHYLRRPNGARPAPSPQFDNAWYRKAQGLDASRGALEHYLGRRPRPLPNPLVGAEVLKAPRGVADPYEHFLRGLAQRPAAFVAQLAATPAGAALVQDALELFVGGARVAPVAPDRTPGLLRDCTSVEALAAKARQHPELATTEGAGLAFAGALTAAQGDIPGAAALFARAVPHLEAAAPLARALLAWALQNWTAPRRADLAPLIAALHAAGHHAPIALQRLVETAVDRGDAAAGARAAADLHRLYPEAEKGWALIALARLARLQGDRPRAVALLRRLQPGADKALQAVAITLLIENEDFATATARLSESQGLEGRAIDQARLRLAVHQRDFPALIALLQRVDAAQIDAWVLCEAAYRLARPGIPPEPDQVRAEDLVMAALSARGDLAENVLMAQMHVLLQRRRFEDLAALFARIEGHAVGGTLNLRLRRLEFLGLTGRLDEALALYRAHLSDVPVGKWEGMSLIRLLSEAGEWQEAGAVVLRHIRQGFGFGTGMHAAMRIIRKVGLHDAVAGLAAGGQIATPADPALAQFLDLVQEDQQLAQTARALDGPGLVPGRALGGNWILQGRPPAEGETGALVLCSNRRYFLSLLTFLCSYFGQSQQATAVVHVFLDADVPRSWQPAIATVAARFNRVVEVIQEDAFVPQGISYRTDFGFFAGGSSLSRAAYFRLYAARWILARGRFARLLYLDTDIICRGDLTPLLNLDLQGAPLAARIEDFGPEVKTAALRNALDPERYFNSGVLVMDLAHPALKPGLDAAIHLSEAEPERLVLHDQCALNIAFAGAFTPLPEQWNFFLRPFRERNGHIEDGILLHYLDKPKPWNIVYSRNYREEWRVWALHLSMILPQSAYIAALSAANEE